MALQWYQIIIWIIVVILIAYIAGFIFVLARIIDFRVYMRKGLIAASILFSEKKEVLINFYSLMLGKGVVFNDADADMLAKIRWQNTDVRKGSAAQDLAILLDHASKRLTSIATKEKLLNDKDVIAYFDTLKDIDVSYRRIVAVYNNNLVAYEYWRKRKIYTWIFYMMFFREQKRLA